MGIMDLFKKKSSGNVAKDRLKLVLVSDRANCSSEMMEMMKRDIIEVISRYMDIDAEALDVKITETESDSNNGDRKSTRLNSSHLKLSRMPSSA